MKVLLTGSSGFIGRNFILNAPPNLKILAFHRSEELPKFAKEKNLMNIEPIKCDLTDIKQVSDAASRIGQNFDSCIYLAGNVNIPLSVKDPLSDLNSNAGGIINFLTNFPVKKLVYMSSAAVYEGNKGIATTESPTSPYFPYSISKLTAEHYIKYFSFAGVLKSYVIIRFGGAYGPYSPNKFMSKLVSDIYLEGKNEIDVYGDGTNIVNLMYVKDTIKALVACLKSDKSNLTTNLGQDNFTIRELVSRVSKVFRKEVKIRFKGRRMDQKYISFRLKSDFNRIFGFKPDYAFDEGVAEFGELLK